MRIAPPGTARAPRLTYQGGVLFRPRREGIARPSAALRDEVGDSYARGRITTYPSQPARADPRRLEPLRLAGICRSLWAGDLSLCSQPGPAGRGRSRSDAGRAEIGIVCDWLARLPPKAGHLS